MFSLSKSELAMHENLIPCIIFSNKDLVQVKNENTEIKSKIICIKPDVSHGVSIPQSGAEILYLDGVKLGDDFADFEALSSEWADIPEAFHTKNHKRMDELRNAINGENTPTDELIFEVIESLYRSPLDRMTQEQLAQSLGLERSQALKYFKSETGQTFRRFKKWAATVTVTSSVFNDGQIISHAGIDAGFSDAAHTSRTAKEIFGLTPSAGVSSLRGIWTLQKN